MSPEIKINLHPVNLIIISGILQSVILAGLLIFSRKGNKPANVLIGLFVFICSLHFSWSLIIDTNLADIIKPVFWFPYSYLLAIGPLLYFYTKKLTDPNFKIDVSCLSHFLPATAEVLMQCFFIWESIQTDVVHYSIEGFLSFRIVELTAAATSIFIYGKQSLSLIRTHETWLVENYSNPRDVTLSWLFKLITYLRVLWIFWFAFELSFFLFLQFQMHHILVYLILYTLLGVITYSNYWIGIQAFSKSEILIEKKIVAPQAENASVYSRLSEKEIKGYVESLSRLMETEKLYLHETLNLRLLANRLHMDPNLVSYILNTVLHKSFYDFVNEFRIEEVKRKIDDPDFSHIKIVEIAYESGFNSKATFNRVFKNATGKSPSEYRKSRQ